jgi:hypothetical protein
VNELLENYKFYKFYKKACRFGHLEVVKYLIEKNVKTEVLSNNGSSLLAIGKINNFYVD